jgi:hypothetical protein
MSFGYADRLKQKKNVGGSLGTPEYHDSVDEVADKMRRVAALVRMTHDNRADGARERERHAYDETPCTPMQAHATRHKGKPGQSPPPRAEKTPILHAHHGGCFGVIWMGRGAHAVCADVRRGRQDCRVHGRRNLHLNRHP